MKVGIGIRYENRTNKNFLQYASQIGATHAVVFMPDGDLIKGADVGPWSVESLTEVKNYYRDNGLVLEGFENFEANKWHKILLDLPGKEEQMECIKRSIANMGKAGIPIMGYNFSIAGVCARYDGPFARGGASTVRFNLAEAPINEPYPAGWAFNRHVMPEITEGTLPFVSMEEMVQRRDWFLSEIIPVAEEAGVQMAAHPEDPPIPVMKNTSRILTSVEAYDEMFKKFNSPSCTAEFCQGTFGEMAVDIPATIKHFGDMNKISYVHFRNVVGNIPSGQYTEVFIDEGDMDMVASLQAYADCGYTGLLMPDHTPEISCANYDETGMAFAIGYIRGIMKALKIDIETL